MKNVSFLTMLVFSGSAIFASDLAVTASKCRELASVTVPTGEGAEMDAWFEDAENAYRDCRSSKLPVDVRALALRKYAVASELRGERQAAVTLLREAIDILGRGPGDQTVPLIEALDQVRSVETDLNLRSDAKTHGRRALELRQRKFGRNSSEAVVGMVHIALTHATFGDYAASESLLQSAVRIAQKTCGPECHALAFAYAGMYALYDAQGDTARAKQYQELGLEATPPTRRGHSEKE